MISRSRCYSFRFSRTILSCVLYMRWNSAHSIYPTWSLLRPIPAYVIRRQMLRWYVYFALKMTTVPLKMVWRRGYWTNAWYGSVIHTWVKPDLLCTHAHRNTTVDSECKSILRGDQSEAFTERILSTDVNSTGNELNREWEGLRTDTLFYLYEVWWMI